MSEIRKILFARGISEAGNAIRQAILALAILGVRNDVNDLFTAEVLETLGVLLITLVGPLFVDRFQRRVSLISSDVLCVGNSIFLFWGTFVGSLEILFLGSFLTTFFSTFYRVNLDALASEGGGGEVEKVRYGLSRVQLSVLIGALVGLVGTSLTIPKFPLHYFFLFDGLTFLVSSLLMLSVKGGVKTCVSSNNGIAHIFEAVRVCVGSKTFRLVMGSGMLGGVAYGIMESSVVVHLKNVVELSDFWVTASRALSRIGAISMLVFSFVFLKKNSFSRNLTWIWLGGGLAAAGLLLMASSEAFWFLTAGIVFNAGLALLSPAMSAILGSGVSPSHLGRVFLFYTLVTYIGVLMGNGLVLLIGDSAGTSWLLTTAGAFAGCRLIFGLLAARSEENRPIRL